MCDHKLNYLVLLVFNFKYFRILIIGLYFLYLHILPIYFHPSQLHCMKSVRIWNYSGYTSYLSVFSLNAGKCGPK